jgi:energy-coupling factor transporter ATP-binding protein EcfA2
VFGDASTAEYYAPEVDQLLIALEEATRATPAGGAVKFVPPAGGELAQAQARFHHLIFGRRGSGKTTLLRHLENELGRDGQATVWIDQELFMELSFPDVLVSSVLEVMQGIRAAFVRSHDYAKSPAWRRFVQRLGLARNDDARMTLRALDRAVENLSALKHLPNDRKIEWTRSRAAENTLDALGRVSVGPAAARIAAGDKRSESVTETETVTSSKEEYLERSLIEFRKLIVAASKESSGGFVFLDEFYRVRRDDQPLVLGYVHRLVKDTGLWLKVGSVRYWTTPYRGGSPPRGIQSPHDAKIISLDRGLQFVDSTQGFVEQILGNIAASVGIDIGKLMTTGALRRLVLASGGVPRDYLQLAGEAIKHARNRGQTEKAGSEKVMAEDVNQAAGQTAGSKLDDLREDAPDAAADLELLLEDLAEFCRHNNAAYFLFDGRDAELSAKIDQLQDLRFAHLLQDGETVPDIGSRRHKLLLLDVAYLSARRALQIDFEGWQDRSKRRRRQLVYSEGAGARLAAADRGPAAARQLTSAPVVQPEEGMPPTLPLWEDDSPANPDE